MKVPPWKASEYRKHNFRPGPVLSGLSDSLTTITPDGGATDWSATDPVVDTSPVPATGGVWESLTGSLTSLTQNILGAVGSGSAIAIEGALTPTPPAPGAPPSVQRSKVAAAATSPLTKPLMIGAALGLGLLFLKRKA